MAIDQSLNPPSSVVSTLSTVSTEARTPKTVTLEVTERQAEVLLVAAQLGKISTCGPAPRDCERGAGRRQM